MLVTTLAVGAIWFLVFIPEFEKIPNDFQMYMEHEGEDQVSSVDWKLSEPFKLRESSFQKIIATDGNFATVLSTIRGVREDTGQEIFHFEKEYQVNVYSWMHKDMAGKQFGFKHGVEKRDYDFYHPMVFADAPLVFQKTENIDGLETYVFKAVTQKNDLTKAYPQFNGITILSDTVSNLWVEPITGDLIKYEKNWEDYHVEPNQEKKIVEKGWKRTTDYSVFMLIQATKAKIANIDFYTKIIPMLLFSLSIGINLIFILRDRLKQIKESMIQKERLAAIGNLSSRIAHDLRNPLSVIKNEVEIMSLQSYQDEKMYERVKRLTRATDRMNRQINGVMDFVREKPLRIEQFSSNTLIESVLSSITIPKNIKIIAPKSDVKILGDFTQLETALSNIIINSIQALEESGEISMSVENTQDRIIISISDSGPGISEKNLTKIFEPLFTTKQQGTGLGLSSCHTIIKNHGGSIAVRNNPTTFTIQLPKTQNSQKFCL